MACTGTAADEIGGAAVLVGEILKSAKPANLPKSAKPANLPKSAKPANLPIQQPAHFCPINLKTAASLGLSALGSLLAHADEVIE